MEEIAAYLKRQHEIANSQGKIDFIHDATQLAISKIRSCKNTMDCLEYTADELDFTFTWFAEAFIANYCCEECKLYEPKKMKELYDFSMLPRTT